MRHLTCEREGGEVDHQNTMFEICRWRTLKPQGNTGPKRPAKGNSPGEAAERKGERRAFLLPALEASWPIGGAPSPRTLDDSSEGNHPISEDARRLLGREQLAAGESTGTCGVMANHTKSITQTLPAPKVCGDTGIRTTDHTGRRLLARV